MLLAHASTGLASRHPGAQRPRVRSVTVRITLVYWLCAILTEPLGAPDQQTFDAEQVLWYSTWVVPRYRNAPTLAYTIWQNQRAEGGLYVR